MTTIVTSSGIEGTDIKPDTPEWLEWFTSAPEGTKISFEWVNNAFKIQRFTAYRRKRYWEAQKRVSGKLRNTTIKPSEASYELLKQIGNKLTAYNWTSPFEQEKSGNSNNYQTSPETTLESGEDIAKLQARIIELEQKLSSTEKKLERESGDAQRYYVLWRKYPDLERQLKRKEQKLDEAENQVAELKVTCKRINLECKVYKLHGYEVVRLKDLTKLGYELQRSLIQS